MPNVALRVKRPSARKAVSSPAKSGTSSSPVKVSPVKSPAWPVKPSASPVKAGPSSSHSPARASTSRNSVSGTPKSSSRHTPNVPQNTPTVVLRNTPTISTPKSILKRSPKKDLKRLNPDGSAVKPKKVVLIEPEKKSKPKAKPKKPAQEETSYVVEAVVSKKKENGETFYKIRWAGYGSKDDSWVSEKNCSCHWAIKKFEEEKKKGKDSKESKKPAANQEPEKAKKRTQSKGNTFPNKRSKKEDSTVTKSVDTAPEEEEWEDIATAMPPPLRVSPKKSPPKKQKPTAVRKAPVIVKVAKRKSVPANNRAVDNNDTQAKPAPIQWNILSEKLLRTIPQLVRDRLDKHHLPVRITDARNPPPASDDEGFQRYHCEWDDGLLYWLPGKLCCKVFPNMVCDFGARLLALRDDFIRSLTDQQQAM